VAVVGGGVDVVEEIPDCTCQGREKEWLVDVSDVCKDGPSRRSRKKEKEKKREG
jgi:hypothetical protein